MSENVFTSFATEGPSLISNSFMDSNTILGKVAFLLVALFVFVLLFQVGLQVLARFFSPANNTHLLDGMIQANQMQVIPQSKIVRSSNQSTGVEFTWSVWVNISDLKTNVGLYKHIFSKGNSDLNNQGVASPNNAPGLYLAPNTNTLVVIMNTYEVINEEIFVPDIPLNRWVNVIIRCENTTLDVYINGTITRSIQLAGVPKQNNGDVYVAMNGGFDGYISNLWYYNRALGSYEIQGVMAKGPSTKYASGAANTDPVNDTNTDYLSLRWYMT
jgi:hypothetical protein